MKTKKLNARASVYANSVEPEDNKNNDACWMAARRGYIAGWKARKEKEKKPFILVGSLNDDIPPITEETAQKLNDVLKPRPLFTTEDGVDLYIGSNFWVVDRKKIKFIEHDDGEIQDVKMFTLESNSPQHENELFFSTKHAAEKWIEEHKSLKPEDLEDGEIYFMQAQKVHLFRFREDCKNDYVRHYSWYCDNFHLGGQICVAGSDRICRHATLPEKLKLIGEELKHGYTHK